MYRILFIMAIAVMLGACNSGGGSSGGGKSKSRSVASSQGQVPQYVAINPQRFDPAAAWPLCGRITESAPANWQAHDGCPASRWGSAVHTDFPLVSHFGPRLSDSDNYRYDFHRGIDITTPVGTPIFAISDGTVRIAGNHPGYHDPMIQLRHKRPGASDCSGGCYYSNYNHLSSWVVSEGASVTRGQLIGYTGANEAGHPHLHFEVRDVPANSSGPWKRYAIHPLNMLPYNNCSASSLNVRITGWDTSNPLQPVVNIKLTQSRNDPRVQIRQIEIEILERDSAGQFQRIPQPGEVPNEDGYFVYPAWLDFDVWNHQYTHMNSTHTPWEDFENCPFSGVHGTHYDPNVHLDQVDPVQTQQGRFNGITLTPAKFDNTTPAYRLGVRFEKLVGGQDASRLCVIAHVTLYDGQLHQDSIGCDWQTASQVCDASCEQQLRTQQRQRCGD